MPYQCVLILYLLLLHAAQYDVIKSVKKKCKCSVAVAFMEMQTQAFTYKHGRWSHYKQLRALALAYIGDEMGFGVTACPLFFI